MKLQTFIYKLEFSFIKQNLSEVNSYDSSGSWLRMRVLGMEVHGDCSIRVHISIT